MVSAQAVHETALRRVEREEPRTEAEAYRELTGMLERRLGSIPAGSMARHVLAVTPGADWPVRHAASAALLRRWGFAERDELKVKSRPRRGPFGEYTTRRRRADERPYRTQLFSLEPLDASCSCLDFARSSLRLCKHVLVIIDDVHRTPAQLRSAAPAASAWRLGWEPVRPLYGRGDFLERIRWHAASFPPGRPTTALAHARRHFRFEGRIGTLADAAAEEPAKRLAIVQDLTRLIADRPLGPAGAPLAVDGALPALLEAELARLERAAANAARVRRLGQSLKSLKRRLYPYQLEGVHRFVASGRLLLADDMGLGKTAQAIAACHVLWSWKEVSRGLVVVPASLKGQWLREWRLFTDAPVELVEGPPAQRQVMYERARRGFLIVNYEQVVRDAEALRAWQPDIVVLDEAQRIKNWATKTAGAVKQLEPTYRLVLTGTPMENRLDELASVVEWIDHLALAPTWRLTPLHVGRCDGERQVAGARHLDTLRARLTGCMLRRLRRDVLAQLPPRTDSTVPVELTAAQREEHASFDPAIAQILGRARRRPLTREEHLRLMTLLTMQRIVCNGLALYQFAEVWPGLRDARVTDALLASLASPKLAELRELVRSLAVEQGRKIVVFSQWRRMLELALWAVRDLLEPEGLRALFFTGQESPKRRTQNVIELHDDPAARIMFLTDAGGVGLNLQRAATACINLDLPWNPAVLEQRIGRIYRLGQTQPVEIYNLVAAQGIEARIVDLVGNKRALFTGLFDGASDEVPFERGGSFLERVADVVAVSAAPPSAPARADEDDDAEPAAELAVEPPPAIEAREPLEPVPAATLPLADTSLAPLAGIRVATAPDGSITISAPPAAAAALGALLRSLAGQLLGGAAAAPEPRR